MSQSREGQQADAALIAQGWVLLGRYPDCVVWRNPDGLIYALGAKVNFTTPSK